MDLVINVAKNNNLGSFQHIKYDQISIDYAKDCIHAYIDVETKGDIEYEMV